MRIPKCLRETFEGRPKANMPGRMRSNEASSKADQAVFGVWPSSCRAALSALVAMALAVAFRGDLSAAEVPTSLRAGAAAVDISPRGFPVNMPGGFSANPADGVHDPLHARAVVMSRGDETLAIVIVDTLGLSRETTDDAKAAIEARCGIVSQRILICATHTHSAPPSGAKTGPPEAVAYRKILLDGIVEAVAQAHAAMKPAAVGHGVHRLPEEVFNRRWYLKPGKMPLNPFGRLDAVKMNPDNNPDVLDRPAGPTDPDIVVLSIQDARRRPLALLANYALHYVGGTPRGEVSADYFGEFARLMPSRVRGDEGFVAMMSNGASGDINNIPFLGTRPPREPFEQVRIVAQKAADAAWHAWRSIESHRSDATLAMIQREVELRYRRPSAEELAAAKAVLAITDPNEREKLPRLAENYARNTVAAAERQEDAVKVVLQAIRIGDLAICAIPFETFCEIGLDLKKRSPFARTIVISHANGSNGYLPTPEQHRLGGYETWLGTCRVQEDASVIITNQLIEMLGELNRADAANTTRSNHSNESK